MAKEKQYESSDKKSKTSQEDVTKSENECNLAEEEPKKQREQLEELVRERTAELHQSEENFRNSLDTSPLGMRIVTADGETLYVNRALLDIYGYGTINELRTMPVSQRYTAESYAEHQMRKEQRRLGLPVPDTYEISIVRKDGAVRQLIVYRREVTWDGKPEYLTIYQDITERKRMEEEILNQRDHMKALSRRLLEAQEEERRTIALELHDEIGQSLNALKLLLDRQTRLADGKLRSALSESSKLTGEILERVRQFSLDLRPKMLDDLGLLSALVWYFRRYSERTGVKVDFRHSGLSEKFSINISSNVYRIVQQALTNVARHAAVDRVKVRARVDKNVLRMKIEDKGTGFDIANQTVSSSSGLEGMRERARLLGGSLTIDSAPVHGTRLLLEIPLQGHDAGGRRVSKRVRRQ